MFDLITGNVRHTPRHQSLPILVSTAAHVVVLGIGIAVPLLFVTNQLPEIPSMMAFVAAPPAPPPPPPPAAPVAKTSAMSQSTPTTFGQFTAPTEVPPNIEHQPFDGEDLEGVPGGVEGGIQGGVVGGVIGGLPDVIPPPPPPPPPRRVPVRPGGQIQTPALIRRIEPYYPPLAVSAHIEGMVILEAIIDEEGAVSEVKVLRSAHPLLDREATLALRQWRYSPLFLNGVRVPFILTVTLSFTLEQVKE